MEFFGIPVSNQDTQKPYREAIKEIRLIIINVDGVLTDGYIQYTESGDEIKTFYARDGFAIREAMRQGLKVVVISERQSRATMRRLIELGVTDIYLGIRNKLETYQELKVLYNVEDKHCLYIGDDISDLPILERVGFPCAPINSIEYLRHRVAYLSPYEGGRGCVRDVLETVLLEQGKWKYYQTP